MHPLRARPRLRRQTRSLRLAAVLLVGIGLRAADDQPAADAGWTGPAWKLDRPYAFAWIAEGKKIGDVIVRFRREEDAEGEVWAMSSERRLRYGGREIQSAGRLLIDREGRPLHYTEETQLGAKTGRGRQDTDIRFARGEITSVIINNGRADRAAKRVVKAEKGTQLFATGALDHWLHFCQLLEGKKVSLPIFYPEFGSIIRIEFSPREKLESIEAGGERIEARRYDFRYENYPENGSIWVDAAGRLLRYESGKTRFELD